MIVDEIKFSNAFNLTFRLVRLHRVVRIFFALSANISAQILIILNFITPNIKILLLDPIKINFMVVPVSNKLITCILTLISRLLIA